MTTAASKTQRTKFGISGIPIPATRVLSRPLDHKFGDGESYAIIAINDQTNTYVAANVYNGNLGRNFSMEAMTHELPPANSPKTKDWSKKYTEAKVSDFDVLAPVV